MKKISKYISYIHYVLFYIVFIFLILHLFDVQIIYTLGIFSIAPFTLFFIPIILIILSIIATVRLFIKQSQAGIYLTKLIENHVKNALVFFFSIYAIFEFTKNFGIGLDGTGCPQLYRWISTLDDIVFIIIITSIVLFIIGFFEFIFTLIKPLPLGSVTLRKFALSIMIVSVIVPVSTYYMKQKVTQSARLYSEIQEQLCLNNLTIMYSNL